MKTQLIFNFYCLLSFDIYSNILVEKYKEVKGSHMSIIEIVTCFRDFTRLVHTYIVEDY